MDSFELNKIAGALLATLLVVVGLKVVSSELFEPHHPEKPGFEIAVPDEAPAEGGETAEAVEPLPVRLASADAGRGEAAAKKCAACHNFEKGAGAKVGPDLFDVLGRDKASAPGFSYSKAMQEQQGEWTYDDLDVFLTNPKKKVPGTSMSFAGIKKPDERANVIAYLRGLSDSPKPLPEGQTGAVEGNPDAAPKPPEDAPKGPDAAQQAPDAAPKTPDAAPPAPDAAPSQTPAPAPAPEAPAPAQPAPDAAPSAPDAAPPAPAPAPN